MEIEIFKMEKGVKDNSIQGGGGSEIKMLGNTEILSLVDRIKNSSGPYVVQICFRRPWFIWKPVNLGAPPKFPTPHKNFTFPHVEKPCVNTIFGSARLTLVWI